MRILIDIGHPGHVHFFKYIIWALKERGHTIFICARAKDVTMNLLKHYGFPNGYKDKSLPRIIYNHFETYKHNFDKDKLFKIMYNDLKNHKLFVKKEDRRKFFKHIKQVKINDPYYLKNQKGVMVL